MALAIFMVTGLSAQTIVGTEPTLKNAILEEFTGIHCGYCPDGHAIAKAIMQNNPGRAFAIAIHQGSFAAPSAGEPDYRTPFGDALASQAGVNSYPAGTVNRHVFSGTNTTMGRGSWTGACNQIMAQASPVNIGVASQFNPLTRALTVDVELYYTSNSPASSNFINVVLIQDSIYGPQIGGGAGNNYLHMRMLRHMITGQWGDEVTTTTQGSLVSRTYSYTIPASYNNVPAIVANMKVVAFVTESHQEIYTGTEVAATGGTNLNIGSISSIDPNVKKGYKGFEQVFDFEANSNINGTTPFLLTLENENLPADWIVSFEINGIDYINQAEIDLTKGVPQNIKLYITPGEMAGFPALILKMKSLDVPAAPEQQKKVKLIAGVTDLVVNGTGGPETILHQGKYLEGLEASGITSYAVASADDMRDMVNADAASDVFTLWLNIAWTFPALSDSQAEALMDYMDAGGNVFIAGQDIGWDIMSGESGSNGNAITRNFYTNYLKAGFVNDGTSANNKLNANTDDDIFGTVPQSNIIDVYGGNMYPDVISAGEGADVIFNYTDDSKVAAIKYEAPGYRSIYFGVGLEMISNADVRNEIISLSRQWLSAEMVGTDYQASVNTLIAGQNYPNPAQDYTFIPVSKEANGGILEMYNVNGVKVMSQTVGSVSVLRVELNNLPSGLYTYRIINGKTISDTKKLSIVK